ncbi:MAG: YfiH family protein, partial [Oceanospirillaceae bacterium]
MQATVLNSIKGIQHDFGTYDEPKSLFVNQNWSERARKKQIHGTKILVATKDVANFVDADGVYTTKKNLLLPVVNADCYPLLFSRKDGNAIAALHVGWRGALEGIIYELRDLLEEHNHNTADWVVAIGPGAKACCYQVSTAIINEFSNRYSLSVNDISPQRRMLDLSV